MNQSSLPFVTMDEIVREGDPILRKVTEPVNLPLSDEERTTVNRMMEFLKQSQDEKAAEKYGLRPGIGLSANQIGWDARVFVVYFTDDQDRQLEYVFCNPKIVSHSAAMTYLEHGEGCLSVDRPVDGYVPRYEKVTVQAFTPEGQSFKLKLKGFSAIVFQHEYDHLNGVMFYDHINRQDPFTLPETEFIKPL
ncbi:peptide deformylase [Paenibacillus kandeliae]|uniref:peptide deformylase n=1 Tax=Paenibacillus kandeliae TaxID=3231269 RepID=UPI003459AA17